MAYKSLCVVALLVALQVSSTIACVAKARTDNLSKTEKTRVITLDEKWWRRRDDYELIISKIEKCPGVQSIVNLDNFNVDLTEDCKVVPRGNISYSSFNSAKMEVDIMFKGRKQRRIQKTVDFCERMKSLPPVITNLLKAKNLSTSCPIVGKSINTDGFIVDITKYKQFLGLGVGNIYGTIKTTYDTGASCYSFNSTLKLRDGATKKPINRIEVLKGLRDLIGSGKKNGGGGGGGGGGFGGLGKKWWKKE